jgi:hypothetical protein
VTVPNGIKLAFRATNCVSKKKLFVVYSCQMPKTAIYSKAKAEEFGAKVLFTSGKGMKLTDYPKNRHIFLQGDQADSILRILKGKMALRRNSWDVPELLNLG